ncbi:MAG: hydroxymethylglutaryl-CoA reductase, degradative [Candidatus Thermoplasmatota archaeon]
MASWSGFYRLTAKERLARVAKERRLSPADAAALANGGALGLPLAGQFIENAVGAYALPLGFAVGFVIDGADVVVPMAVEESSVVAAACNGAKMAAAGGGFKTSSMDPVTIGQVEVRAVRNPAAAAKLVKARAKQWMADLDAGIPSMVARGGGVKAIVARVVGPSRVVVHLHVDTRDAMGANVVNTLCEKAAPGIVAALGGKQGLRILSNLADQRLATAKASVPVEAVGGLDVAKAIVEANRFALEDPYRAATHNKGVLNGIDPVVIATGNDWRAVEAGAHAYAARDGAYRALTSYRVRAGVLECGLTVPVSVGTVGGVTKLHPTAAACLKVLGSPDAMRLARIVAAVGLAQNLSALRALSVEGIQDGHMRLHASNLKLLKTKKA